MEPIDIKSQNLSELKETMEQLGEKPFVPSSFISGCTRSWRMSFRI